MNQIKKFIDKVSLIESRQSKDLVMPVAEARLLRDELAKILIDYYKVTDEKTKQEPVIQIELKGNSF